MRNSSRAGLSPWFWRCGGSVIGLRFESAVSAGSPPVLCEAARGSGRRFPERRVAHRSSSHSGLRGRAGLAAGRQGEPFRAIASWGLGAFSGQIARSHEGGIVGHALGAKRVALGPLSPGLARGAPDDGVGVPAPGFATIDLHADCGR